MPGATYLFEAVYPENKIVVHYDVPALVMLGAYDPQGLELSYEAILGVCERLGWRPARRHAFASVADMVVHAHSLPATDEGFVIRILEWGAPEGERATNIGASMPSSVVCTPLALWESEWRPGTDWSHSGRDLPEEFWGDLR